MLELASVPEDRHSIVDSLFKLNISLEKSRSKKLRSDKTRRSSSSAYSHQYDLSRYVPIVGDVMEDFLSRGLSKASYPFVVTEFGPDTSSSDDEDQERGRSNRSVRRRSRSGSIRRRRSASRDSSTERGKSTNGSDNESERVALVSRDKKRRLIIFVAGGVTASEMRLAYEISKSTSQEVIIGGSAILTPKKFIENLNNVTQNFASTKQSSP